MSQYLFGAGFMFCIPKVDVPTPRPLGTLQDVSIEFSGSIKELFGQNQFAEATARGQQKVSGKAKFAKINIDTYNDLYFNETVEVGQNLAAINEGHIIPSDGVVEPQNDNFLTDLGAIYADTGKSLKRVAATPGSGEYTLNAGTGEYLFATADANKQVYLSYLYTDQATGKTIIINNQPMGEAPTFKGIFNGRFSGLQTTLILNSCTSSKLNLIGTKLEDFNIPEFDFSASVDAGGRLGTLSAAN